LGVKPIHRIDPQQIDVDPPVNLRGFSGAPIIDGKGYLVGVLSGCFFPEMVGDKFLEGGAEDVIGLYELLRTAE